MLKETEKNPCKIQQKAIKKKKRRLAKFWKPKLLDHVHRWRLNSRELVGGIYRYVDAKEDRKKSVKQEKSEERKEYIHTLS
jgi:hypothetical protein